MNSFPLSRVKELPATTPDDPPSSATSLRIGGMTCGHCVERVRAALASVPGAKNVEVSIGRARVTGTAAPAALVAAVSAAGYAVRVSNGESPWARILRVLVAVAAVADPSKQARCRALAEGLGARLRVRPYES